MKTETWLRLLDKDPRPWLLESEEPAARWVTLVELLDRDESDAEVQTAHEAVLADRGAQHLLDELRPWDEETGVSGHDKPGSPPNQLNLLADMGVRADDDPRIAGILGAMLEHQDEEGRFQQLGRWRGADTPVWGALLCDTHAIAEVLARFGYAEDRHVGRAFAAMEADLTDTAQGRAWPCREDPAVGFRGPGRKGDPCPQVALEALRAYSYLPEEHRPDWLLDVARVALRVWRDRGTERPYMFGHGRRFKETKWPTTWYGAFEMVDTLGRYPALWRDSDADPDDRRSLAEVAACLVAYNVSADGTVTPRSCFRGFEEYSFGRKKAPSAFSTARVAVVVRRLDDLVDEIEAVDVLTLGSAKGGDGTPLPPRV